MSRGSPISQWWDFEKTSNNDKYHHYMENAQKWRKQAIFHWKYLYFHQYLVKLRTVVNFGLIFIILFKLNGKQLCKKILFMKNKCGSINDHNNIWHWNRHMSKFAILNLSCLLESVVLWRHLVAIKRQGDIRLTFVADNRPMALLSNRRIVETSTPSLLAISICFNLFLFALHKCPQTLSFCEVHHVESKDFPFLVLFFIYELFCSFLKCKTVHLFLFMKETFKKILFL